MSDLIKQVCFSKTFLKKLKHAECPVGFVAGWVENEIGNCVDCAQKVDYFLTGLDTIGFFCLLPEEPQSDTDLLSFAKNFLTGEFEVQNENTLVLFIVKEDGGTKLSVKPKLYSSYYCTIEDVELLEESVDTSECLMFRAHGQLPLIFEGSSERYLQKENLDFAVERVKALFQSDIPIFYSRSSSTFLRSSLSQDVLSNINCKDYVKTLNEKAGKAKQKLKAEHAEKIPTTFEILLQTTGKAAVDNNVDHSLVIHCQRRNFLCVSVHLPIDVLVISSHSALMSQVHELFVNAILHQLNIFASCLEQHCEGTTFPTLEVYHFYPYLWEFPISVVYPHDSSDSELEMVRASLHKILLLPSERPFLRKSNRYFFPDDTQLTGFLINPHESLPDTNMQGNETAFVYGKYVYHHYMQDHVNDDGWGCAYRSLQTIISWYRLQGYTNNNVPTHTEIQQALVDIGDKPSSFVGSRQWIGSQEVSFCLNQMIGVTSKIICVNSGEELIEKSSELLHHFQNSGTPIMIGGGVLAHTILGISFNRSTGDVKFLVLDPHYTGSDDVNVILNKSWCGWKGLQFWDKTAFYNLCLPQRPIQI